MNLRLIMATLTIGLVTLFGCPLLEGQWGTSRPTAELQRDQAKLAAAHKAFMDGDHTQAKALFTAIQHAQDADLARHALYGLACTQLVSAQTPQEFDRGLKLWDSWTEFRDPAFTGEDPRLLAEMLPRMAPKLHAPPPKPAEETQKSTQDQTRKLIQTQRKQNEVLEAKIELLEKEIRALGYFEEYSRNLEAEIQTLRHKIQTMQAIDQNIQQKKQEIQAQ